MRDRILDLTEAQARLRVEMNQLVIERRNTEPRRIPLEDIAAVIVGNYGVTYTNAVLAGLAAAGAALVVCGERNAPSAMMLPLAGNSTQAERMAAQSAAPQPVRKRLWASIARCKIEGQGRLLAEIRGEDHGLFALAGKVRSGDPDNLEAQAARRYWTALFADPSFRRGREEGGANRYLNYGYAVLRALASRAICGSGLHPGVGLHHHNKYGMFPLADDLMEPFRPLVDRAALFIHREWGPSAELDRPIKAAILGSLLGRVVVEGEARTVFDALSKLSASLSAVFLEKRKDLILPESLTAGDTNEEAGEEGEGEDRPE